MAKVTVEDVRDVLNLTANDISDQKIEKMIKRAAVTVGLELGREINAGSCTDAEKEAITVLAAIYAICYLTGGTSVGLNFIVGDRNVSVLKSAPPLNVLQGEFKRIINHLKKYTVETA